MRLTADAWGSPVSGVLSAAGAPIPYAGTPMLGVPPRVDAENGERRQLSKAESRLPALNVDHSDHSSHTVNTVNTVNTINGQL